MSAATKLADELPVTVSKFTSLGHTTVAEQITVTWDQFLGFLAAEPADEFRGQMKHPGWSPVIFNPPERALMNVREVFGLVLDFDRNGDWDKLLALWGNSYGLLYTTKSHGAAGTVGDRLRVILPLSRVVTPAEQARLWDWAARRSGDAGCPADTACKDASRFWYDPTQPPGTWRSQRLHGEPIDVDAVLALVQPPKLSVVRQYSAPTSDERTRRASAYLAKLPGAVSGDQGHAKLFNAVCTVMLGFDLSVDETRRLIASEYNPRCDPPWSEKELEHKLRQANEKSTRERGYLLRDRPRVDSPQAAAASVPTPHDETSADWSEQLLVKKDRSVRRAFHNTCVFVRHHPDFRGKWALEQMTESPWFDGSKVTEALTNHIRAKADCTLGYTPSAQDVEAAIRLACEERPFHPVLQYLRSLDWDGTPRLATMARDYLGSSEPHHAEMVRKFMIGAAARAIWPGCKLDTALMLVGDQGFRKSTFFEVLGGEWHGDSFIDITNKDGLLQLHRTWIYELAELENVVTGRAESRLKAWMTSRYDMYRAPYARDVVRKARAVVICGTTNRRQFLTDYTGSRRFWIVPIDRVIPFDLLREMRDQLWAEATCAAEAGETWWLESETDRAREEANAEFMEEDAWEEPIAQHLAEFPISETSVGHLLENVLKVDIARRDRAAHTRVGMILSGLGWRRVDRRAHAAKRRVYVRPNQGD